VRREHQQAIEEFSEEVLGLNCVSVLSEVVDECKNFFRRLTV